MQNVQFQNFRHLIPSLIEKCEEIGEIFNFSVSESLILFHHFKWNDYALSEFLANGSNLEDILINSGSKVKQVVQNFDDTCPVCFSAQGQIVLSCGHNICQDCLNQYFDEKLRTTSFITCFHLGCKLIIPYQFFINQKSYRERYILRLSKDYHTTIKCCKNEECEYYISELPNETIINCLCGVVFCLKCDQGDHKPLSCEQCQDWIQMFQASSNYLNFVDQGKFCPKCKQLIEKDRGCNHMTCRKPLGCGHEFCWICLEPWKTHSKDTGGYYQCNKYDETAIKQKNQLQQNDSKHQRLIFYSLRYQSHEKGQMIAMKRKRKFLNFVNKVEIDDQYKKLLTDCFTYIIQARNSLKWTYVYGYYLIKKAALFEFSQADFERYLENLHNVLEFEIYENMRKKLPIQDQQQKLLNLYSSTQMFQKRFLSELQQFQQ